MTFELIHTIALLCSNAMITDTGVIWKHECQRKLIQCVQSKEKGQADALADCLLELEVKKP